MKFLLIISTISLGAWMACAIPLEVKNDKTSMLEQLLQDTDPNENAVFEPQSQIELDPTTVRNEDLTTTEEFSGSTLENALKINMHSVEKTVNDEIVPENTEDTLIEDYVVTEKNENMQNIQTNETNQNENSKPNIIIENFEEAIQNKNEYGPEDTISVIIVEETPTFENEDPNVDGEAPDFIFAENDMPLTEDEPSLIDIRIGPNPDYIEEIIAPLDEIIISNMDLPNREDDIDEIFQKDFIDTLTNGFVDEISAAPLDESIPLFDTEFPNTENEDIAMLEEPPQLTELLTVIYDPTEQEILEDDLDDLDTQDLATQNVQNTDSETDQIPDINQSIFEYKPIQFPIEDMSSEIPEIEPYFQPTMNEGNEETYFEQPDVHLSLPLPELPVPDDTFFGGDNFNQETMPLGDDEASFFIALHNLNSYPPPMYDYPDYPDYSDEMENSYIPSDPIMQEPSSYFPYPGNEPNVFSRNQENPPIDDTGMINDDTNDEENLIEETSPQDTDVVISIANPFIRDVNANNPSPNSMNNNNGDFPSMMEGPFGLDMADYDDTLVNEDYDSSIFNQKHIMDSGQSYDIDDYDSGDFFDSSYRWNYRKPTRRQTLRDLLYNDDIDPDEFYYRLRNVNRRHFGFSPFIRPYWFRPRPMFFF